MMDIVKHCLTAAGGCPCGLGAHKRVFPGLNQASCWLVDCQLSLLALAVVKRSCVCVCVCVGGGGGGGGGGLGRNKARLVAQAALRDTPN